MSTYRETHLYVGYEFPIEELSKLAAAIERTADIDFSNGYHAANAEVFAERFGLDHNCQDDDGQMHVIGVRVDYDEPNDKCVTVTPDMIPPAVDKMKDAFECSSQIELIPVIFSY